MKVEVGQTWYLRGSYARYGGRVIEVGERLAYFDTFCYMILTDDGHPKEAAWRQEEKT